MRLKEMMGVIEDAGGPVERGAGDNFRVHWQGETVSRGTVTELREGAGNGVVLRNFLIAAIKSYLQTQGYELTAREVDGFLFLTATSPEHPPEIPFTGSAEKEEHIAWMHLFIRVMDERSGQPARL